jgi:hypothetical protein
MLSSGIAAGSGGGRTLTRARSGDKAVPLGIASQRSQTAAKSS